MYPTIAIFLPILAVATPLPQATPNPEGPIVIESAVSGSACPPGASKVYTHGPDVTVDFEKFEVNIGPNATARDRSGNCQLMLNFANTPGYQYAVTKTSYNAIMRLDEGVTGTLSTTYFYSQDAQSQASNKVRNSPPRDDTEPSLTIWNDTFDNETAVWSPCHSSGLLNVNFRMTLTSKKVTGTGMMTWSSHNYKTPFNQTLHISARRCGSG